ncbi:MAG: hypothetical protein RR514_06180, partial [Christensenella sp.]
MKGYFKFMDAAMKRQKSAVVMPCLLLVFCAFFFVTYGLYVYAATIGEGVTVGQIIYNLYAYGGFMVICLAGMALTALIAKGKKASASKVFIWGAILLAYHFASQFFANVFNLAVMDFAGGLVYSADYLPCLILVAVLIALLTQWNAHKKITNYIAWIGLLVSAFLSGWLIYHKLTSMISMDVVVIYDALFSIAHALVVPFAVAFLWNATRKPELFEQTFVK